MKKCFYEILGIDRKATTDEIKTAYKKQAIMYHPDKNKTNENAKEIFQTINEAYQVLSDPNERTWYDNHRVQILSGKEDVSAEDFEEAQLGFNIWQYFTTSCYQGYDDKKENNFYSVYREVFEKIKWCEQQSYFENQDENDNEQFEKPPGFGDSNTGGEIVNDFYNFWLSFSTCQNFGWADVYNPKEAENRQVRRLIEKENKKSRTKERKKFNKNIMELVKFIQRRDPRWREFEIAQKTREKELEEQKKKEKELELEEKKRLLKERREEEIRRFEEEEKLQEQQKLNEVNETEVQVVQNVELYEYLCEICNKSFKSENQMVNHNQSKGHLKRVKQLMKEVAEPEEIEEFEEVIQQGEEKKQNENKQKKKKKKKNVGLDARTPIGEDQNGKEEDQKTPQVESQIEEKKFDEKSESSEDDNDLNETEFLNFGKQQISSEKKIIREKKKVEEQKKQEDKNQEEQELKQKQVESVQKEKEKTQEKLFPEYEKEKKKRYKTQQPQNEPKKLRNYQKTPQQIEKEECLKKLQQLENQLNKIEIQAEKKNPNLKKDKKDYQPMQNLEEEKTNKVKARRSKKKEEQVETQLACKECKQKFDSRNKLFKHIQETGHAAYK